MVRVTGRPLSERVTVRSTTFFRVSVSEANRTPPFSSIVTNCGSAARTAGAAMRTRVVEMWQCMGETRNGLMEIIAEASGQSLRLERDGYTLAGGRAYGGLRTRVAGVVKLPKRPPAEVSRLPRRREGVCSN